MCPFRAHYLCLLSTSKSHLTKVPLSLIVKPPVPPKMVLQGHRCGSYCHRTATPLEAKTPRLGFMHVCIGLSKGWLPVYFNPLLWHLGQIYLGLGWIIFEWHSPDHKQNSTDNLTVDSVLGENSGTSKQVPDSIRIFLLEYDSQNVSGIVLVR